MRRRRHFVRQGRGGHLCRLSPRANAGHETRTDRHSAGALIATCRPRSSPRGGSPVSILSHQLILTLHCWRNQLIFVYRLGAHGTSINITSKWSALLTSAFGCYGSVLTGFWRFQFREYFETRLTSYCHCYNLIFLGKSLKIFMLPL